MVRHQGRGERLHRHVAAPTRREAGRIRPGAERVATRPASPRPVAGRRWSAGTGLGGLPRRDGAVAASAKGRHVYLGPRRSITERCAIARKSCCRHDLARCRMTYPGRGPGSTGRGAARAGCAWLLTCRGGAKSGRRFSSSYSHRCRRINQCQEALPGCRLTSQASLL